MPLSPNVARYTREIIRELELNGKVQRPATRIWQSRIHNAARRMGWKVETHTTPDHVVGILLTEVVLLPCAAHGLTEHTLVGSPGMNPCRMCVKCRG